MTYAEARQVMRRLYDERVAAQKLHEVLEKAVDAESSLGHASAEVTRQQARILELEAQYHTNLSKYQDQFDTMEAAYAKRRGELEALVGTAKEAAEVAQKASQTKIDSLNKGLTQAQASHEGALKALAAEAKDAKEQTAVIVAALESTKADAKAHFKALFG